jgi:uncharacterized protein GlcG (DUF336 family)
MSLNLEKAEIIVDATLKEARRLSLSPLTVTVLDSGGHVIVLKREDGAGILRPDIAFGKAWGALGMGFGSRNLAERAASMPLFFTALAAASGGRMIPVPGGVLVKEGKDVLGAVGASGATSDEDEACVVAGIKQAGFSAVTGA